MTEPGKPIRRTTGSADLARRPCVEVPAFPGPLVAFDPGLSGSSGGSVCLGGDLHAVHPAGRGDGPPSDRDGSLDLATVILFDDEGWSLDVPATEGIWSTRPGDIAANLSPYFALTDGQRRLRTWLILPPPRTMIDIAHLWLPSVPPRPGRHAA
jgi:hypothetical protein